MTETFRRTDTPDTSTLYCVCGDSYTWAGVDNLEALDLWRTVHMRHTADDRIRSAQAPSLPTLSIQTPKPGLPVARCADCLYASVTANYPSGGGLPRLQSRCLRKPPVAGAGWYCVFDTDWCGEFAHKTLGSQWTTPIPHDPGDLVVYKHCPRRKWRFPTEPE